MGSRGITDIDKGWNAFRASIDKSAGKSHTKVGFPAEGKVAKVKDGTAKSMIDQVQIAAVHEFGAPKRHIPERSFVRATYDENVHKLNRIADVELDRIFKGQSTLRKSLARMGEFLTAKMKNRIRKRIAPPLSPATIKAKGSDVPLIDTAQMIQSITHVEVLRG